MKKYYVNGLSVLNIDMSLSKSFKLYFYQFKYMNVGTQTQIDFILIYKFPNIKTQVSDENK